MQLKRALLSILFCAGTMMAQNVYDVYPERVKTSDRSAVKSQTADAVKSQTADAVRSQKSDGEKEHRILTGFTGGMKLHMGYAFAKSSEALFGNNALPDAANMPKDGVTMGLGGELRVHMLNHVHLGAEGGMSMMPLMTSGSSLRSGWGGVLCDYYGTAGKVQLCIGGMIGGGTTKRLYVPNNGVEAVAADGNIYNALYKVTPYFLMDPYIGLEAKLTKRMSLLIKIDYMLPLKSGKLLYPSGPRLYVGLMFGKHDKGQSRR